MKFNNDEIKVKKERPNRLPAIYIGILLTVGLGLGLIQSIDNLWTYIQVPFVRLSDKTSFDYTNYENVLKESLNSNLVDYNKVKASPLLNKIEQEFATGNPDKLATALEKKCFWINAYNFFVLKTIAKRYPVKSKLSIIQDFSLKKYIIAGKPRSINELEEIIERVCTKEDPRYIFLLCGGTKGYPILQGKAISPQNWTSMLFKATDEFISNERNVLVNEEEELIAISLLFKWREKEIVLFFDSPFDFVNHYLPAKKKVDISDIMLRKEYFPNFDWAINATETKLKSTN